MKKSYEELLEGYRSFRKNPQENLIISEKQDPKFLIISCSDSRVIPNFIFQASAGEVFTTRNIANIVPPYDKSHSSYHGTSAVIEYAVKILKVKHLIIMGHTKCGGIEALVQDANLQQLRTDFVGKWMEIAKPALDKVKDMDVPFQEKCEICTKETIKISLANLASFPFVKEGLEKGLLEMHGIIFDIDTYKMSEYKESTDKFEEII